MRIGRIQKRLIGATYIAVTFVLLAVGITGMTGTSADGISVGGPSDCDSNAVIRCGAHSTGALVDAYQASPYVHHVYSSFGISSSNMGTLSTNNVVGKVTNKGNVYIDGKTTPIARNAMTGGRQDMPGSTQMSTNGDTFYKRSPSVSFQSASLPAFVSMKDGVFQYAIIASCGNPVSATPVTPTPPAAPTQPTPTPTPTPPAPTPTPTPPTPTPPAQTQPQSQTQSQNQTQSQTQSQSQTVNVTPAISTTPTPTPTPTYPAPTPTPTPPQEESQQEQPVVTPAAVTTLPNTGASGIAGLFGLTSLAGYFGYRRYLIWRKL